MLKGLQHPNIVKFYDYWERTDGKRKFVSILNFEGEFFERIFFF